MARKLPLLRVAGPTVLVSLLLFTACTVSAVFLYRVHARTAEGLTEDIDSRRKATELETTTRNLASMVRKSRDRNLAIQVEPLNERVQNLLDETQEMANTEREAALQAAVRASFERYHEVWESRFDTDLTDPVETALKILERETLPAVGRLRDYNNEQIHASEHELRRTIKWFAWGLAAVGCIGSLGGILFGYGVARALRLSIYKLSVRIRDAADKLGHDLPTVTITEGDGIDFLHEQMQSLMREIEQMADRLHQREREVLRAEQLAAVGQMAAGVAHELRNPLTAVKMLVETSREDLEARGLPADDLDVIEQEVRRLERSLQAFLDFARPPKMERRLTDLSAVIRQALALLGGRTKKQNVRVEFDAPEPPVRLEADGEQLRQLLVNLMMNALDAMPQGGTLTVKVAAIRLDRSFVEVHVCDTGAGIAAEILPRLFQPFVSGKETGLGLGRVVSRRIAEEHGGSLWAGNPPGGGAALVLRLPADAPRPAAPALMAPA